MAVSNSTDFSLNRNQLIDLALELVGAKEADLTPSASEVEKANKWFNVMIKSWHKGGTTLNVRTTGTIFLEKGKQAYNLGTGTYAARGTVTNTTTTSALVITDTVIPVTSSAGMLVSDNIGILLDDDTIQWTTIQSVDSSIQVTIAVGLTGAALSGTAVHAYTNIAHRPVKLHKVVLRDTTNKDIPLSVMTQDEYMDINDKVQAGNASSYFYDPQLGDAVLSPWPVMDSTGYKLIYKYIKPFDDLDNAADNVDFEAHWELAIIYSLAEILMTVYAVDELTEKRILRGSNKFFKLANKSEVEEGSIYFQPSEE